MTKSSKTGSEKQYMSLGKIKSMSLNGIDGYVVTVEVDISNGLPAFDIVGLPDASVKESKERVKAALKNSNYICPVKRITVNLAPADRKKEGPSFDLPITVAILLASGQIGNSIPDNFAFLGELSLDGKLRSINGVLPMVLTARNNGIKTVFLPSANAREASVVNDIEIIGADNLTQIVKHLKGEEKLSPSSVDIDELFKQFSDYKIDFSDVKGQHSVKRAIEVAVAGNHNILMIGSPGSGKSMIAQRIPTILPNLTFEEALETTKIHSVSGVLDADTPLVTTRPFRSPHHTISAIGLIGGGSNPRPGEISIAHNGVLFLDELPEFQRNALEVLRQPLEDGKVNISRINASYTYPSNVLLVASMNPCKCGYYGDPNHECTCTPVQIQKYMGKISGPLLDRIDIHIEVPSVTYSDISSDKAEESSFNIKRRVENARKIQLERYKNDGIHTNSQLSPSLLRKYCKLTPEINNTLRNAFNSLGLSARAHNRILKVARTIADLEGEPDITISHIGEAIQYRSLDRKFWGA
ncbi:MAG: YifB family Mg chelatase-like AAA ATPase [Clostridia bacterium]|nr:YifB family Mg chelatase-like AAA ATPase [Clostridia bacterium]